MPIYLYKCTSCHETEEHIQKFSDPHIEFCDACGGRLERVLTAAAAHFKGGGWASEGYASSKPPKKD